MSGIDISIFTVHSTRGASSLVAADSGVAISDILKQLTVALNQGLTRRTVAPQKHVCKKQPCNNHHRKTSC